MDQEKLNDVNDKRQVFAYVRVSTNMQQSGLLSQMKAIKTFCEQNEISNYKLFQDEGISGAKSSRPALDAMMREIEENKCKMLICFSFSRVSRSCLHLLRTLEVLDKNKVRFVSTSEKIDTESSIGKCLIAIIGSLAQLERDLIRERILSGLARAREAGRRLGRLKTRPSEMLRSLYLKAVPYREIARICKCSEGCVGVEAKLLKHELGEDKVKELRRASRRRGIIAYKPEVKFDDDKKEDNEKGEKPISQSITVAEVITNGSECKDE